MPTLTDQRTSQGRVVQPWAARGLEPDILRWDGKSSTDLIAQVEACVAAGAPFAVSANVPPCGGAGDRALLERWWDGVQVRLAGLCVGWAVIVAGADVNPGLLLGFQTGPSSAAFPIRNCADQAEALRWLRYQLARAGSTAISAT